MVSLMKNKLFVFLYFIVNLFYMYLLFDSTSSLIYERNFTILNITTIIILIVVFKQFITNIINVFDLCLSKSVNNISFVNYFMYISESNFYMTVFVLFVPMSFNINNLISFIANTSFIAVKSFKDEGDING